MLKLFIITEQLPLQGYLFWSEKMKEIYAIGPSQNVLLFQSIGITSYIINNEQQLREKIESLASTAKIIFISEALNPLINDLARKYQQQIYPILLFIPLEGEDSGMGIEKLKREVEKAIGMAII